MRTQLASVTAVTFALALAGGCSHSNDNDGLLREYRPLPARGGPTASANVSRSRLPASGNAQASGSEQDPMGPWGGNATPASPAPVATARPAAPVDLDAEAAAAPVDLDAEAAATPVDLDAEASASLQPPPAARVETAPYVGPAPAANFTAAANEAQPTAQVATYTQSAPTAATYTAPAAQPVHSDAPVAARDGVPARLTVRVEGKRNRCKVAVCGQAVGRAPFRERQVTAGRHLVSVTCAKGRTYEQVIELEPGRSSSLLLKRGDLKKKSKSKKQRRRRGRL